MRRTVVVLSSLCLLLEGCVSLQTVQVPQSGSGPAPVQVGDTVQVTTREGQVRRFQVTEVTDDALLGKHVRIAYTEMTELKTVRKDDGKSRSVLWVIGGVALAVLIIGASGGGGSSY